MTGGSVDFGFVEEVGLVDGVCLFELEFIICNSDNL